ncbi:MAG TPA: hypothetical protein PLX54_10165 [Candidatus Fermentibacter daniensis]|nr:hypothetical protein [Candidatus Fermentibacter daniensis]HOR08298.1 hypothetical protein [Candidatus Fermentibacter daniensis]HPK52710.1 hypothetical protein [Candidatus Fermentibacter daniensis]
MGDSRIDTVGDWVRANYHRWGSMPRDRQARIDACVDATGTTRHYASSRIRALEAAGKIPVGAPTPAPSPATNNPNMEAAMTAAPGAISEDMLRSEIDVHFKARRFLEAIKPGEFYRLDDAAVAAGVPKAAARQVFGDARYAAYRGQAVANGVHYLGHPDHIAAMKQEAILR